MDEVFQNTYTSGLKSFYEHQDHDLTSYLNRAQLSPYMNIKFLCNWMFNILFQLYRPPENLRFMWVALCKPFRWFHY